ncbi:MAG: hypothetical protein IPL61_26480 [Myxococcales bacterium]|nr:hypothetical protein [Myxococcales bacterium]
MRRSIAIVVAGVLAASAAAAAPPPHQPAIATWARRAGFKLAAPTSCTGPEERAFQALGATCWRVKRRAPRPRSRMYPRLVLRLQTFTDEAAAKRRIARFHDGVRDHPELEKAYPLRAGFRLGDRVLVVATDARAFEADAYRAAAELAARLGGTDLVCWRACPAAP